MNLETALETLIQFALPVTPFSASRWEKRESEWLATLNSEWIPVLCEALIKPPDLIIKWDRLSQWNDLIEEALYSASKDTPFAFSHILILCGSVNVEGTQLCISSVGCAAQSAWRC